MVTAIVQTVGSGEPNFGHCFSTIEGLSAGDPIRISSGSAAIYCRLAWDLQEQVSDVGRVALDSWQCAALAAREGTAVDVTGLDWLGLPMADSVELRLTRWSGPPTDHSTGLPDFLRSGNYLLYPGLRFSYKPLGETGAGSTS